MRELAEIKVFLRTQSKEIEKLYALNLTLLRNTQEADSFSCNELPDDIQLSLSSKEEVEYVQAILGCAAIKKALVSSNYSDEFTSCQVY